MFSVTIRDKGGQVYTFHFDKPEILIGRVKGNDVILPKQNISKRHALVRVQGTTFIIEDLGSTNGTYVNGHRIQTPVQVGTDDKVHLGDFLLQFFDLTEPLNDGGMPSEQPPPVPGDMEPIEDVGSSRSTSFEQESATEAWRDKPEPAQEPVAEELGAQEPAEDELASVSSANALELEDDELAAAMAKQLEEFAPPPVADEIAEPTPEPQELASEASGDDLAAALEAAVAVFDEAPDLSFDEDDPDLTGPAEVALSADGVVEMDLADSPLAQIPPPAAADVAVAQTHLEALGALFDAAIVDLADVLSVDVNHLSESQWASMEARVVEFVEARAHQYVEGLDSEKLTRDLIYELSGLGPLEALLDDGDIERIEINGPADVRLHRSCGQVASGPGFSGVASLNLAAERLVRAAGVASKTEGMVRCTLSDGTAVCVVWPPLSMSGPVLNLVRSGSTTSTLADLVDAGYLTAAVADALKSAVSAGQNVTVLSDDAKVRGAVLGAVMIESSARSAVLQSGASMNVSSSEVVTLKLDDPREALSAARALNVARVVIPDCGADTLVSCALADADAALQWYLAAPARDAQAWLHSVVDQGQLRFPGVDRAVMSRVLARPLHVVVSSQSAEGPLDTVGQLRIDANELVLG